MTSQNPSFVNEQRGVQPAARRDWRCAAVLVAARLLATAGLAVTPASAQHRSENDGRALDRNTRVGSGGRNDGCGGSGPVCAYGRGGPMVTGN